MTLPHIDTHYFIDRIHAADCWCRPLVAIEQDSGQDGGSAKGADATPAQAAVTPTGPSPDTDRLQAVGSPESVTPDILDRLMELWEQPWSEERYGEAQVLLSRIRAAGRVAPAPQPEPRTFDDLRDWMRHDPEWACATVEKMAGLLREWADAWAGPTGDPDKAGGPLVLTRSGLYDESRAILGGDR